MAEQNFKVAIVGCGRISAFHLEAISKIDGLSLVAVCDIDESRARATGEAAGVPWFTTIEKMLAAVPADIVSICTPSGLHPDHGVIAAKAGKHVISEKPMALSLDAADKLIKACDDAGVRLF